MAGTLPSEGAPPAAPAAPAATAVTAPSPVGTTAGTNFDTADPGVLLDSNHFYASRPGDSLKQFNATEAGVGMVDARQDAHRCPAELGRLHETTGADMIKTTSGVYVVYFSAALTGTAGNPPGADLTPAAGARCIGTG